MYQFNQEDITTLNMHASNNKASETWSKIDRIKKEVSKFTNIDLYSNSFNHSVINRTSGEKKIRTQFENMNDCINQPDLTDIHRTPYPTTAAPMYFSSAQGAIHQDRPYSGP